VVSQNMHVSTESGQTCGFASPVVSIACKTGRTIRRPFHNLVAAEIMAQRSGSSCRLTAGYVELNVSSEL